MKKDFNPIDFVLKVIKDCKSKGVKVVLSPGDRIILDQSGMLTVSGYWDAEEKTLNVAVGHDEWLTVLAHEYGHFCQWKEKKYVSQAYENAYVYFDEWLLGERDLTKKQIDKACLLIQKCELDCEKRALKFIKQYELYHDYELYIQKANSYVLSFEACKKLRKWFAKAPSRISKIYSSMPKTFTKQFKPTKTQMQNIKKFCFKERK